MAAKRRANSRRRSDAGPSRTKRATPSGGGQRWLTWLKRIAIAILVVIVLGVGAVIGAIWHYGRDLPAVDSLHDYQPPQTTRVVDRDGEVLGEIFTERRTVVPRERIPNVLVWSVLAAEDADFYEHEGLDYPGLVRAVVRAVLTGKKPRGTSTITQQLVKLMLLTPEQTVDRKIRELILARRLEQELDKDEILYLYLNHINYGHGRYGVQEAAQYYFGKNVEELDLAEASLIAGLPQAPTHLSPRDHPEAARRRQTFILDQLEAKRAERWPDLALSDIEEARRAPTPLAELPEASQDAPEVLVMARQALHELVSEAEFERGGYTVHTSIDLDLTRSVRAALQEQLRAIDERHGYRGPLEAPARSRRLQEVDELSTGRTYDGVVTGYDDEAGLVVLNLAGHEASARIPERYNPDGLAPSAFAEEGARVRASVARLPDSDEEGDRAEALLELGPEGAVVVIEPRSREVLALVGGYRAIAGFNRATQAVRQPGSTFKPIVYALGIRSRRFTPASIVVDAPVAYADYRLSNYETWEYEGEIRLREALARSVNPVALRVIDDVSPQETAGFARQLGITTELDPVPVLALGASDVRPIEMVNAYATFAAGGRWAPTRIVTRVEGPGGRVIEVPRAETARDALTPAEAFVVTSMLTSVVESGTASRARRLGLTRPAAGKTGTSDEARDTWFVGYTPSVVAGVWIGFDDRRPLGRRESGGRAALPVWVQAIEAAEEGQPAVSFPVPTGVVTARIDPASGLLAYEGQENAIDEYFLEDTVPTEQARSPEIADPNTFLMEQFGQGGTDQEGEDEVDGTAGGDG